ncbi:flagellar basal body rod protein FlgC [Pelagicoccus sp. NFK12]|uniref:Flagellar basal-body rod protein FlgC n=1 Tax=Pelagicoccus enzymogenes TaxID=2773457 RepID=A0A927IG19_9BACT|nr:flagellar basal body rod protein FlgC [Pelagicoccus enzymogenes]MBD5778681.1 flagellar basal body rod protein FlgC [Pelagicoccus enzymogenes]MDQ8196947.1 flagellar basal body rod protein FlgC [Pelagicoccus enzymogenes]
MNLMPGIDSTSSALQAEKLRMDIIGQNIANAHTTRGPDGKPYQRQTVQFEAKLLELGRDQNGQMQTAQGVNVRNIVTDETAGPLVFNPGHPDADEKGMVRLPNVNLTHEMVDLISASRSYEANLQVVRTSKQMAQQALKIGKH